MVLIHDLDLDKLPPPLARSEEFGLSPYEYDPRRSQSLMIGGVITLAVGIGVTIFLNLMVDDQGVWAARGNLGPDARGEVSAGCAAARRPGSPGEPGRVDAGQVRACGLSRP